MNLLSLAKIRRPVLFETALQNADTAQLQALCNEIASLDPRRRKLLEAELSRRVAAANHLPFVTPFSS